MIRRILTYYAERLDEYLTRFHRRPEGLATVGLIGNATEESPNKTATSGNDVYDTWKLCQAHDKIKIVKI